MVLTPLLLSAVLLPPSAPVQVPDTHVGGEIVLELRDPEAFLEGLHHHGIVELLHDEEMTEIVSSFGPMIHEHLSWLEHASQDQPLRLNFSMNEAGWPDVHFELNGELAEVLPDGITFGLPDGMAIGIHLDAQSWEHDPTVVVSAHWEGREIDRVRETAERLLNYVNRMALQHGSAPVFSASAYGGSEIWKISEPDHGDEAVFLAFDEGALVFSNRQQALISTIENRRPQGHQALHQIRQSARPGSLIAFVDVDSLIEMGLSEVGGHDRREAEGWLNTLGIDSWKWAAMQVRPEEKGIYASGHLEADGTRGLLGMLNESVPAAELFAGIPQGCQAAFGVAVSPSSMFSGIQMLAERAGEGDEMREGMAQAGQMLGMPVDDFVDLFGDRAVVSARLNESGMLAPPDLYFELALRDHNAAHSLNDFIQSMTQSGMVPLRSTELAYGAGYQVPGGNAGPYAPAFVIYDDRLRMASSKHALNRWLGEDLQPSGMQDVLASLSHGSFQEVTGLMVFDLPTVAAYGYQIGYPFLAGAVTHMEGELPFTAADLPSKDVFLRNLPPFVRSFRVHDRGIDFETHGLF